MTTKTGACEGVIHDYFLGLVVYRVVPTTTHMKQYLGETFSIDFVAHDAVTVNENYTGKRPQTTSGNAVVLFFEKNALSKQTWINMGMWFGVGIGSDSSHGNTIKTDPLEFPLQNRNS